MTTALIVCTYRRPASLLNVLISVNEQHRVPSLVVIVDSSPDALTETLILGRTWLFQLKYIRVTDAYRGLTKQRNIGIAHTIPNTDIVCFLDDDLILEKDYFEQLIQTYQTHPDAIGVGGIDLEENRYFKKEPGIQYDSFRYYELDGWVVPEPLRYRLRKLVGLMPHSHPGIIPPYSNGRSSFPPNGKIYPVEHFMGGISSFRREVFDKLQFSTFFEGYGLYEDFDFTVRASKLGILYVNTRAQVWHLHEPSGRPNHFKYGRMVVRNGWYVWRVRFPAPTLIARLQWHLIQWLLILIRFSNGITGPHRTAALKETAGRIYAWTLLFFSKPSIE